jgi:hypothetical protein
MTLQWIKFRLQQSWRLIQTAGLGLLLVGLVVTAGITATVVAWLLQATPQALSAVSIALCGYVHWSRADTRLLRQLHGPAWRFYLIDYGLICVLLALAPLYQGHFLGVITAFAGMLWAFSPVAPALPIRNSIRMNWSWLPADAFEWRYNIRQQGLGWVLLALPILLATYWHWGFFMTFMVIFLLLLPAGYDHLEPPALFPATRAVALKRWRAQAKVLYVLLLPAWGWLLLTQFKWWWLGLYLLVAAELLLLLCTTYKWYVWAPSRRRVLNGNVISIGMLGLLIPGGIIGTLGLTIYYFIRSKKTFR